MCIILCSNVLKNVLKHKTITAVQLVQCVALSATTLQYFLEQYYCLLNSYALAWKALRKLHSLNKKKSELCQLLLRVRMLHKCYDVLAPLQQRAHTSSNCTYTSAAAQHFPTNVLQRDYLQHQHHFSLCAASGIFKKTSTDTNRDCMQHQ
jgi:hypothetical protein